ncbi:MAG: hypothetical protein H7256_10975 [Bdellovibrio sp.]|nr:hypothetical protein [Bdellovibrio sp.]
MKFIVLILIVFTFNWARAMTFEVIGKNGQVILKQELSVELKQNVGQISVQILNKNKISFEGGEFGLSSLVGLGQDIDVISDTEMKAYGWCFSIDGVISETMPDQTWLKKQNENLLWFYGYAHYKNGDWIGQCLKD